MAQIKITFHYKDEDYSFVVDLTNREFVKYSGDLIYRAMIDNIEVIAFFGLIDEDIHSSFPCCLDVYDELSFTPIYSDCFACEYFVD